MELPKKAKKNGMTREQAAELYKDLQKSMAKMLKNEAEYLRSSKDGDEAPSSKPSIDQLRRKGFSLRGPETGRRSSQNGALAAVAMLMCFTAGKVALSALEYSGFASVAKVEATQMAPLAYASKPLGNFSKEEVRILTSLDSRRAQLDERGKLLDDREQDMERRDREFTVKLAEIKELTDKLNLEHERDQKKKSTQLEQLSNVYGSMNPAEAAKLIEQLDVTIAIPLIERMPEKRIGQILASMSPERALTITKMLSNKAGAQ